MNEIVTLLKLTLFSYNFYTGLVVMYCLFVNALYDWYITKTNSCVHLNVTDVIDEYISISLYIYILVYMSFPSCEYRQAAAGFKSKDKLNSDCLWNWKMTCNSSDGDHNQHSRNKKQKQVEFVLTVIPTTAIEKQAAVFCSTYTVDCF